MEPTHGSARRTCSGATTTCGPSSSTVSRSGCRTPRDSATCTPSWPTRGADVPATSLATDTFVCADSPPVLDARAKAEYRRRLDDLDRELDRAAVRGDDDRAETLEQERQALLDELRRAAGLGGRDRSLNSDRERLRKTVTARIRDTLAPTRRPPPGSRRSPPGVGAHRRRLRLRPDRADDVGPRALGPQPNQAPSGRRVQCRLDVGHRREQDLIAA